MFISGTFGTTKSIVVKKIIALITVGVSFGVFAQSTFSWEKGIDTMTDTIVGTEYVELKMYQINESGDTLNLGIEVVEREIPAGWDGMVCLYGKCLGSVPDTGFTETMNPLEGDEKGYVRWTVSGRDTEGNGKLRIRVYDLDNESYSDTATWVVTSIMDTTSQTSSLNELENNPINVYPNPSVGIINWNSDAEVDQIKVYNLIGEEVHALTVSGVNNGTLDLSIFKGILFVCFIDTNKVKAIRRVMLHD